MLSKLTNLQRAQSLSNEEKPKQTKSMQKTVTGQEVASPLSDFLDDEVMQEIIPGDTSEAESAETTEALDEITEEMEASASQIDKEALVAELLETVPELQIEEEQLDVFAPVETDGTESGDSAVKNLVEAVVETMTETSAEKLVSTFVQTEDIAKLVSSKTTAWSHVGMKLVEKTIMLLKNGMAYTDLTTPPGELAIPSTLASAVDSAWTTWRQDEETGAIYLGSDEGSGGKRLIGAEIDLTPLSIEDIAGTHTKVRAESWSSTQVTRWSDIVFHDDGTFEYAETKVRTTGGIDTIWQESFTQSASYLSANRPQVNEDGTVKASSKAPRTHMFGSFKLAEDGLSIDLTYANGSVESRLMYKNDGYVHFGQSSFKTRHETKEVLAQMREKMQTLGDGAFLGADWISVLADSAAAANENKPRFDHLIHAPRNSPGKG